MCPLCTNPERGTYAFLMANRPHSNGLATNAVSPERAADTYRQNDQTPFPSDMRSRAPLVLRLLGCTGYLVVSLVAFLAVF
jgi:hypothetical protein